MNLRNPLELDSYYHLFNRGIDGADLFRKEDDYFHFLSLAKVYLDSVIDVFAWILLKNHFHFLIKTKTEKEIPYIIKPEKGSTIQERKYSPSRQLGHLFIAYARYFNLKYTRKGALLERPFKRIKVENQEYLIQLIYYIHNNPVSHEFVTELKDYKWSSYHSIISHKPTNIKRNDVLYWFNSKEEFISFHQKENNSTEIKRLLIE